MSAVAGSLARRWLDMERAPTSTVRGMASTAARPARLQPAESRDPGLPISEVAQRTGLSRDTLRYYEKAGLIGAVERSAGGQRRYAANHLDWLAFLLRLRATGMSVADMQRFAKLRRAGDSSVGDRLDLLTAHRNDVKRHRAALLGHLRALESKIAHYQDLLEEQTRTDQP